MLTVNILTFSSLLLYVQYPEQPVCTSLLFTLLFIKSQYTVFLFLYILLFFAHLVVFCTSFLHILLSFAHLIVFCTSYWFLHILLFCTFFYFIAHFTIISTFLTICMPLCYVTLYNLYSYYFALSTERTWFDYISLLSIPCITIMWQIKKPWPWTYASSTGWGATCNRQAASGLWTGPRLLWIINCLELLAVHLALWQFQPLLLAKHLLVCMDSTAAVSYINRLGGLRSHRMSQLARNLLFWSHT